MSMYLRDSADALPDLYYHQDGHLPPRAENNFRVSLDRVSLEGNTRQDFLEPPFMTGEMSSELGLVSD